MTPKKPAPVRPDTSKVTRFTDGGGATIYRFRYPYVAAVTRKNIMLRVSGLATESEAEEVVEEMRAMCDRVLAKRIAPVVVREADSVKRKKGTRK